MTNYLQIILSITLILTASFASALTTTEFITQLKNHPFFQTQQLSKELKNLDLKASKANRDWQIGVDSNYQNSDLNNLNSTNIQQNTKSLGITAGKKIISSGGDLSLKHIWTQRNGSDNNITSIDYIHPLLKNKYGINDRLNNDLAVLAVALEKLNIAEKTEDFIRENFSKFIDLAYFEAQKTINQKRLNLAVAELKLVKAKYAASVVDKADVLVAEDAHQNATQQWLQAKQDLLLGQHELAIILGLEVKNIKAEFDLFKTYNLTSINLSKKLNQGRVLTTFKLNHKILKRRLKSAENNTNAKLDLRLNISSEDDNNANSKNQNPAYKIGLGFSYPLGNTKNKTAADRISTEILQLKTSKRETFLRLLSSAKITREKIHSLLEILKSNKQQIKIAKARTSEQRQQYLDGNGQASFVINAQNNQQNAELGHARTGRQYQKTVLEFRSIIDELL